MTRRKYRCARCGHLAISERFSYSKHTRRHYCLDGAKCEQRHVRLRKLGKVDGRGFAVAG